MTEPRTRAPRPPARARPRRPRATAVVGSSVALFLAVFTLLAWQMRAGRDPALGAGTQAARPAPRRVLVRRVVVTHRHVVVVEDDDQAPAAAAPAPTTSRRTSAPAQAAAPVQATAPAPAPVVTRTS